MTVDVAGDGDCLVWAVRALLLGGKEMAMYDTPQGQEDMKGIRDELRKAWIKVSDDLHWQAFFREFVLRDAPRTPRKTKKEKIDTGTNGTEGCTGGVVDLLTPPRPEPPIDTKKSNQKTDEQSIRVGSARPVQATPPPPSPTLKPPQKRPFKEAEVEEASLQMVPSEPAGQSECGKDVADWAEDMLQQPLVESDFLEGLPNRKSERSRRVCKRVKSERQLEEESVRNYLAEKGITYASWMLIHKRRCAIPKAGLCQNGGFLRFQANVRLGRDIGCASCHEVLEANSFNAEELKQYVSQPAVPLEDAPDARREDGDDGNKDQKGQCDGGEPVSQMESCLEYIRSLSPIIQLEENGIRKGYKIAYRCTICRSKKQPTGKVNSLVRPKLPVVKHFLKQHMELPTHRKNLKDYERAQASPSEKPVCSGLCINDSDTCLAKYIDEFRMWATHTVISGKWTEHRYWSELSTDKWFVQHKGCGGVIDKPGMSACTLCTNLGGPRGIKRYVARFIFKMFSANLLCRRLFSGDLEEEEYKKSVSDTLFGKRHQEHLDKISALKAPELQKLVRYGFKSSADENQTTAMQNFVATTVSPCLKVHVDAVDSNVPVFVNHFLATLKSRNMTEMQEVNMTIATAAATGKLESNPTLQGLMVKMVRTLERNERGVSTRGRHGKSELERTLVADAALTLCLASGGNQHLATKLGQSASPPRFFLDDLVGRSLPCPALALLDPEYLMLNCELVDQRFSRSGGEPVRRLMVALDHTYLQRSLQQIQLRGKRGLVGAAWWPGDASRAFLDMECLPQDVFKSIKAPLMLEILSWDPNSTSRKETFSLASMPTSLTPKNEEEKNRGNYEPCFSFVCFFPSCSYDFPSKNFQDMSRFFFNLYYLESLFRNVLMVLIL